MKKIWETGVILFAAYGFWSMIYPDLCFTEEICTVIYEEAYDELEEDTEADVYTGLCEAKPEQIVIKSRLAEAIKNRK